MTVKELHKILTKLIEYGHEDSPVEIHALIGGRLSSNANMAIADVGMGFDWDASKCVVHPEQTLVDTVFAKHSFGKEKT